jgi:hypothetical protein
VREIRNEREREREGRRVEERQIGGVGYRGTLRVSAREDRGERGRVRERRN